MFTAPQFKLDAFHCPLCGVYELNGQYSHPTMYLEAKCSCCNETSLWRRIGCIGSEEAEMIYPDNGIAPLPDKDMPEDVKNDYIEAARICSKSPRGAAALLRLGL